MIGGKNIPADTRTIAFLRQLETIGLIQSDQIRSVNFIGPSEPFSIEIASNFSKRHVVFNQSEVMVIGPADDDTVCFKCGNDEQAASRAGNMITEWLNREDHRRGADLFSP